MARISCLPGYAPPQHTKKVARTIFTERVYEKPGEAVRRVLFEHRDARPGLPYARMATNADTGAILKWD